jgi:hypothetical protein
MFAALLYKNGNATDGGNPASQTGCQPQGGDAQEYPETEAMRDKRMEANRNAWRKERMACRETTEALLEYEEPTSADMKACQETTACHRATEADTEKIEPDPGKMRSVGEHQEVSKGEAAVMPVRLLRKRCRDRNLAVEPHQKPKERTQGYCGTRKRVTVAGRRMTRCAGVAWLRRGVIRKDCARAKVDQAIQIVWPLRKNLWIHCEGKRGTKDLGSKWFSIHEKEEDNCDWQWRVELKTVVTSGKWRTDLQDPRAVIREVNSQDVQ